MAALKVTAALRKDVQKFYGLTEPVSNTDVKDEYTVLVRRGLVGIAGDAHREALRAIFAKHGADPVHGY